MDISSLHAVNGPDVISEDFDGEMVILNLANGRYFGLRGIASQIWSCIGEGHRPNTILASIAAIQPSLVESSKSFLAQLVELDLIVQRKEDTGASTASINALWTAETPKIEVFDDLAELLLADPIHDVDEEAGWPTLRSGQ